jgi:Ca2+:H+ antiporter
MFNNRSHLIHFLTSIGRNAVDLIIAIVALVHGEIIIVQTFLVGSILSNLLVVLGAGFFFGGINGLEQYYDRTVAQFNANLLALAVGGLIIPTAYTWGSAGFNTATSTLDEQLSYGTSIILLLVYGSYLFFQLHSHKEMYNAPSQKVRTRKDMKKARVGMKRAVPAKPIQKSTEYAVFGKTEPTLTIYGALAVFCVTTALLCLCVQIIVVSVTKVECLYSMPSQFVGLVVLPLACKAVETSTAITVAVRTKMDLVIGIAVGSSMQIALLILPLMVLLSWIIGFDLTLVFDNFLIALLFITVILVHYLIADGKSREWFPSYIT